MCNSVVTMISPLSHTKTKTQSSIEEKEKAVNYERFCGRLHGAGDI